MVNLAGEGCSPLCRGVVFVYTRRAVVPKDVVLVRIDPSVLVIPERAFLGRKKLKAIKLHDELCEIEYCAFYQCTALKELRLSDGVESIGNLTKFRIPPLVTTLHLHVLGDCQIIFSLELIEKYYSSTISSIRQLLSLRNIALASNTAVERGAFKDCWDLLHIFGTIEAIENALQIDLLSFQFIARCTTNLTTIK